jgi:hypothetical protein
VRFVSQFRPGSVAKNSVANYVIAIAKGRETAECLSLDEPLRFAPQDVARSATLHGVQGVGSSNLLAPTKFNDLAGLKADTA